MKKITLTYKKLFEILNIDNEEYDAPQITNKNIYVKTPDNNFSKINAFVKKRSKQITLKFENGQLMNCSTKHIFSRNGEQIKSEEVDDFIDTYNGKLRILEKYERSDKELDVYDISINSPHWYVGYNGIIHHNTFILLELMNSFQRDEENNVVILFESEDATTKDMILSRHLDDSRIIKQPVATVEEYRHQKFKLLHKYKSDIEKNNGEPPYKLMFALDSLGNLGTEKETESIEKNTNTSDMGKRSQLIRATFRTMNILMSHLNIPFVCTNHTYQVPGSFADMEKMSGGGGLVYVGDTILFLTKAKEKASNQKDVIGGVITATSYKSRFTKDHQKVKTRILHDGGLDKYYGILDFAIECGVATETGSKIALLDREPVKRTTIIKNPEKYITDDILEKVNEYVYERFSYGGKNWSFRI